MHWLQKHFKNHFLIPKETRPLCALESYLKEVLSFANSNLCVDANFAFQSRLWA
jgi:hypothetical protein